MGEIKASRVSLVPIETPELWAQLNALSDEDCEKFLDPICEAVGLSEPVDGGPLPNRLFAIAVLRLYDEWRREVASRD